MDSVGEEPHHANSNEREYYLGHHSHTPPLDGWWEQGAHERATTPTPSHSLPPYILDDESPSEEVIRRVQWSLINRSISMKREWQPN